MIQAGIYIVTILSPPRANYLGNERIRKGGKEGREGIDENKGKKGRRDRLRGGGERKEVGGKGKELERGGRKEGREWEE